MIEENFQRGENPSSKKHIIEILPISSAATWQLRQEVMWPDKPLDFVILPNDEEGLHYGLFKNRQLVCVISLFREDSIGQFRKFATATAFQGKGLGSMLLKYLIRESKRLGINKLVCDARVSATGFYEKHSMKVGSEVFQKSGVDYVKMEIEL